MKRDFAVLAHKTCCGNAPPNSMRGLLAAWDYRVPRVECDVTFSKDGEPFIWSTDMDRFGGVPLPRVSSRKVDFLRRSDCVEKVMHVNDVFEFLLRHPGPTIEFDVKYYDWDIVGHFRKIPERTVGLSFEKIMKPAIVSNLARRIGFITFFGGLDLLHMARIAAPQISTSLIAISPKWSFENIDDGKLVCPHYLTLGWKTANHWKLFPGNTRKIVAWARMNGLRIYAGLAANEKDLRWAWDTGFDGVWVDDISWALEVVNKFKEVGQ